MRLLRLELLGFKSFCDKTVLSFTQNGISAVVGPNGCGKSNIIDAIRWTIGEQSAKHLRGDSMEDVIFSGSEHRKAVSMAQVSLTFSNPGHDTLKKYKEFEEISVTRRLYRHGESLYLINNTPCRLMDIRELFMDTGVSGKGYSIIEQGRIGFIVTSKPEDRRNLIDEAAGIVKYKAKRTEAERKLEQTRQNLLRINDIVSELFLQEVGLRQQVEKAEEYLAAKGKIEHLSKCVDASEWLELKNNFDVLSESRESKLESKDAYENKLAALDAKEETLKIQIIQQEASLEEKYLVFQSHKVHIQKLETKLQLDEQALKNLEEWKIRGDDELNNLDQRSEILLEEIQEKETHIGKRNKEHEEKKGFLEELEEVRKINEGQLSFQYKELERLRQHQLGLVTQMTSISTQLLQEDDRMIELKFQVEKVNLQLGDQKSKIYTEDINLIRCQVKLKNLCTDRDNLTIEQEKAMLATNSQEILLKELDKKTRQLQKELTVMESRSDSLKAFNSVGDIDSNATSELIRHFAENTNLVSETGFLGTFSDVLEISKQIPIPFLSYLDKFINTLFFKSKSKLSNLITLIRKLNFRFLEVYFLDTVEEFDSSTSVKTSLKKWLISKKQSEIAFGSGTQILNQTLDQMDDRLWNLPITWIDREKNVLTVEKIVQIGDPNLKSVSELAFERKGEILRLEETSESVQQNLDQSLNRLEIETEKQKELQNLKTESYENKNEIEIQIATVTKEEEIYLQETKRNAQVRKHLIEEKELKEEQTQKTIQKQSNLKRTLEELKEENAKISDEMDRAQKTIEDKRLQFSDELDEYQHYRIIIQGLENQRQNLEIALENLLKEQKKLEDILLKSKRETQKFHKKSSNLESALSGIQKELPTHFANLGEIESEIQIIKDGLEALKRLLMQIQTQIKKEQKVMEGFRKDNQEIEIKLAQLGQKAKTLEKNLFIEYSLAPQEMLETFVFSSFDRIAEKNRLQILKGNFKNIEGVNLGAKEEYDPLLERLEFLTGQSTDLTDSIEALEQSILKMNIESQKQFKETFNSLNEKFTKLFPKLFGGGMARLEMTDETNILETGVEIVAQPPGKKLQSMNLLSGGEKALTAISLVFAILLIKPSPFCVLDEVDAPLDDANVGRFNQALLDMTKNSQFIVITHHKKTMETADSLFGVTMEEAGISKIVSVDFQKIHNLHFNEVAGVFD